MQEITPQIEQIINNALLEDLGDRDITSNITIEADAQTKFSICARQPMLVCGAHIATHVFSHLSRYGDVYTKVNIEDGQYAKKNSAIITGYGNAQAVMAGERVALNLLRQICGVANTTKEYIKAIEGTKAKLLDTRKTIPGLRILQKYAVHVAGGTNHRFGLYDGILIKDNHIAICGGIKNAMNAAKKNLTEDLKIQIECDTIKQVQEAADCGADIILLDNMSIAKLEEAVSLVGSRVTLEASGGVNLKTIGQIAKTGVDFISVGSITNTPANLDIGLDIL